MTSASVNELLAFIRVLDDERDASGLLAEVLLDVSFVLHQSLAQFGIYDECLIREFLASLPAHLLQVHHHSGRRVVVLAKELAVLEAETADVLHPARWQSTGPYAGETAITVMNTGKTQPFRENPWIIFNGAEWHIMLLEWLSRRLEGWRDAQGAFVLTHEQARKVARLATQGVPSQVNLLRVSLLDALGCPRDLVAYLLRREMRRKPRLTPWLEQVITACWSGRHLWPGMSAKLFPLAAVAVKVFDCTSLQAGDVRQCYRELGLSRNAWAHLMRLPADVLLSLSILLVELPANTRGVFLEELSFWLSRLGNRYRYYSLQRERLHAALVWLVYEVASLRTDEGSSDALAKVIPTEIFRASVILLRLNLNRRSHYPRFRSLALAVAQELLNPNVSLNKTLEDLTSLMDWFVAESEQLPERWFQRPFAEMLARSERWHERQLTLARERAAQRQLEYAQETEEDARKRKALERMQVWPVPVMELEFEGVLFQALNSVSKLNAEGILMEHCVGTYSEQCKRGNTLIYAVSRNGQRLGTLELFRESRHGWQVVQFKGKRNKELMPLVRGGGELVEAVGRLLGAVTKRDYLRY